MVSTFLPAAVLATRAPGNPNLLQSAVPERLGTQIRWSQVYQNAREPGTSVLWSFRLGAPARRGAGLENSGGDGFNAASLATARESLVSCITSFLIRARTKMLPFAHGLA